MAHDSSQITRRGFLSTTSALLAGAATACGGTDVQNTEQAAPAAAPAEMPLGRAVDVHHHFWPDSYQKLAESLGGGRERWTPEGALELMDKIGIGTAMLTISNWVAGAREPSHAQLLTLCRECNDYGARLVSDRSNRFGFLGSLMVLPDVDAAMKEMEYALDTLKTDGIGLMSHYGENVYLGDEKLDPVFQELNRRKVVVFVHPASPWFDFRFEPGRKAPATPDLGAWSLPLDTTLAIMNILEKGTVEKYPDIKFIWPHGGGLSIGLLSRAAALSGKQEDGFKTSYAKLQQTMSTFYYDLTNTTSKATSESLLAVTSPSHVLFGTDIPRGGNGRFSREQLIEVANTGFAAADLPGIARGNAEALFPRLKQQST